MIVIILVTFLVAFILTIILVGGSIVRSHYDIREVEVPSYRQIPINAQIPFINEVSDSWHSIMIQHVGFYHRLSANNQILFLERMQFFLARVQLYPIGFVPVERDYLFVAASAIMPIFHLKEYKYPSLKRVILHANTFGTFKNEDGEKMHTAGFVDFGRGAPVQLHLARTILWHDFQYDTPSNVALHEFVHLLDYQDAKMDGIPISIMDKKYIEPWAKQLMLEMHQLDLEKSIINDYAAENSAEFLATSCEHFFKQPHLLEEHHPQLYLLLCQIFKQGQFK